MFLFFGLGCCLVSEQEEFFEEEIICIRNFSFGHRNHCGCKEKKEIRRSELGGTEHEII